jgi:hypothetical protein
MLVRSRNDIDVKCGIVVHGEIGGGADLFEFGQGGAFAAQEVLAEDLGVEGG